MKTSHPQSKILAFIQKTLHHSPISVFIYPVSCCIDLYGALLRLKEWHSAHIEVITTGHMTGRGGARGMVSLPGLEAWREALDVDVVCSYREWTPPTGVIWRGDIHFTENKVGKRRDKRIIYMHVI